MSKPVDSLARDVLGEAPISIEQVLVSGRGYAPPYVHRLRTEKRTVYLKHGSAENRTSFALEAWAYELCKARGVRTPEVIATAEPGAETDYIATIELPGRALWKKPFLSGASWTRVLREAGEQLREMHEVNVDGFGPIAGLPPRGTHTKWCPYVDMALEALPAIIKTGVFNEDQGEQMRERLAAVLPTLPSDTPGRLLHGDLEGDHIFAYRGRFTGFIDFEKMQAGDPVFDLARFAWWDEGSLTSLLDGYGRDGLTDNDVNIRMPAYILANALVGAARQTLNSEPAIQGARMFIGTAWIRTFADLCAPQA